MARAVLDGPATVGVGWGTSRLIVSNRLTFALDVMHSSGILGSGGNVQLLLTRESGSAAAVELVALPVNAPVSSTRNIVSSPFNRGTIKRGVSNLWSHPEGRTSGVVGIVAGGFAQETEANCMFTCLTTLTAAIKSLAEVGTSRVVTTAEAAMGRRDAKSGNVPNCQAVIADTGGDLLCSEPTNTVATADAKTGRTQSSIRSITLLDHKLDNARSGARCPHGLNGADVIRPANCNYTWIRALEVSPKAIVDLIVCPVF